jgi:HEAT repeat protein
MIKNNIIEFQPRQLLLDKAEEYIERLETFLSDPECATKVLFKALPLAETDLKQRIMLLLGSFAREKAAEPFFHIMLRLEETDEIRRFAAIQLSVLCGYLDDPDAIMEGLKNGFQDADPFTRANCLLAMGWRGNYAATLFLVDGLYDPDPEVQQAAVHGLVNLRDDRVLNLLIDRLQHGEADLKRAILCNLWRFSTRGQEVTAVYRQCLSHPDSDLRWDALLAMELMDPATDQSHSLEPGTPPQGWTIDYVRCLRDQDHRIRLLALRRLGKSPILYLTPHRMEIALLRHDPEPAIRQEAHNLLSRLME